MNRENKIINVLDLRDSPWMDGPGRTILETAAAIDNSRFRIIVGAFGNDDNDYVIQAKNKNLDVVVIRENHSLDLGVIKQIESLVRQYDVDIIHTHEFRSNLYGLLCAIHLRVPIITTLHGWITNNLKGRIYRFLDILLLRFFDHITTVSEKLKQQLVKSYISTSKITVINNALLLSRYKVDRKKNTLKDEMGLKSSSVLVANIGRLSPEKGQANLLRAAERIIRFNKDVFIVFIGIGPEEKTLKLLSEELNIIENVRFLGFRKDLIDIYNSIDLVIQSSFTEGMPNVVLEALLMEVPVIATDVGGTSEVLKDKITGTLIPSGSISAIESAMEDFISNRVQHQNLAKAGALLIANRFDFSKRTLQQEKIYLNMLE